MSIEGASDLMHAVLKEQRCPDCEQPLVVIGWAEDEHGPHVQSACGACHPELVPASLHPVLWPAGRMVDGEPTIAYPRVITRVMDDGIQTKDGAA